MFRILLENNSGEASVIQLAQHLNVDEVRETLLGPQPARFQTATEPIFVDMRGIKKATVQVVYGNKVTKEYSFDRLQRMEESMTDESTIDPLATPSIEPVAETTSETTSGITLEPTPVEAPLAEPETIAVTEPAPVAETAPEPTEAISIVEVPPAESVVPEPTPTEVTQTMTDEMNETVVDENKVNKKFKSFREEFLDLEKEQDSWEQQLIVKMRKRADTLKGFADVLDQENTLLEEFKLDKLGK